MKKHDSGRPPPSNCFRPSALLALSCAGAAAGWAAPEHPNRPNIIYILADDLGYGDVGCYGQRQIATPRLDRLAAAGMRFTQHYAGNTVCTPSRSSLLTGRHPGHARHRDNPRFVDSYGFRAEDTTFVEVMKTAGYRTAICGKWHLGDRADSRDIPHYHGFDLAYCTGYPYPEGGREHWPSHVFINGRQTTIPENIGGKKTCYMDHLYTSAALEFMHEHRDKPFLLYLSFQGVHAPMDGAIASRYADRNWPEVEKVFASMLASVDDNVGRVLDSLREWGLEKNTVVFFSSDNGPHGEGGHDPDFFQSRGGLRGKKRDLYEGGIRVPLIVRWPGVIRGATTSDHVCASWDMLATFAELGGAPGPKTDGISLVPALRGQTQQAHRALYWETGDLGGAQAVRLGNWKGVRRNANTDGSSPFELYDLANDPAETSDLAAMRPDVVQRIRAIARESHVPSPHSRLAAPEAKPAK